MILFCFAFFFHWTGVLEVSTQLRVVCIERVRKGLLLKNNHKITAVNEHCKLTGHSVDSSKIKVLATENKTFKRRIREAIEIKLRKPSLNRDNGSELASIYDTILAPWRPLYNPS